MAKLAPEAKSSVFSSVVFPPVFENFFLERLVAPQNPSYTNKITDNLNYQFLKILFDSERNQLRTLCKKTISEPVPNKNGKG
jgi:hypothetical protein